MDSKLQSIYEELSFKKDKKRKSSSNNREKINEALEYIEFTNEEDLEPPLVKKVKKELTPRMITPWMTKNTKNTKNSLLRFHNEIIDFFKFISPLEAEHEFRLKIIANFKDFIMKHFPEAEVKPFGSFMTKLYLPNADIDIVIIDQKQNTQKLLNKVAKVLLKNPQIFSEINVIKNAKVPIIKVIESKGIQLDISFNVMDGVQQVKEAKKALETYPEMKYLIMVLKIMFKQRELHETFTGGVGSFLLFCMVLAFLRKIRQDFAIENLKDMLLSEYLLEFLSFYGMDFDYSNEAIVMADGGCIIEKEYENYSFSLFSPQDPYHDIGNASFRMKEIANLFKNRSNFLNNYNFKPEESVLKVLINPSNEEFNFVKAPLIV